LLQSPPEVQQRAGGGEIGMTMTHEEMRYVRALEAEVHQLRLALRLVRSLSCEALTPDPMSNGSLPHITLGEGGGPLDQASSLP
jgi:hypothetical protein